MIPFIGGTWSHHIHRDRKDDSSQGVGKGMEISSYCLMSPDFRFGKKKSLEDDGDGCSTL